MCFYLSKLDKWLFFIYKNMLQSDGHLFFIDIIININSGLG